MNPSNDNSSIWISAADIFTLLSLTLIVIATQLPEFFDRDDVMALPVVDRAPAPSILTTNPMEYDTIRWTRPPSSIGEGVESATCEASLQLTTGKQNGPDSARHAFPVVLPCHPSAFGGLATAERFGALERHLLRSRPDRPTVIMCAPTSLLDCARLQWVLAERGISVAAKVTVRDTARGE